MGTGSVDFYCSQPHYVDHAAPIWQQLDPAARGTFWIAPRTTLHVHARARALDVRFGPPVQRPQQLTVVFGAVDLPAVQRPILADHGAGQTYQGIDHPAWAGGGGRERVVRFLVPNEHAAAANRRRYPRIPSVIVGSPRVEQLRRIPRRTGGPRVVFSRHWDGSPLERQVPELRSAWRHWRSAIAALAAASTGLVGLHAHPRVARAAHREAERLSVPFLATFDDVVAAADVYAVDNSSTGFEWAALGRPLIWLDAPWFRREVEHGLRFWSHVDVGVNVSRECELAATVDRLVAGCAIGEPRPDLVEDLFPIVDGAAAAAAAAIEELL